MKKGVLHLFPCPIAENAGHTIPEYVKKEIYRVDYFIAERAKTARRFLMSLDHPIAIQDIEIFELDKKNILKDKDEWMLPLMQGKEIGLLSEAGLPCIADPGETITGLAHQLGVRVKPYVGPSSIFLALIASGLNAEQFSFHTYLPIREGELKFKLRKISQDIQKVDQSHIFIETPYRNLKLYAQLLKAISPDLHLCIASDLTGAKERIETKSIREWRQIKDPGIHKIPAVFVLGKLSD